MACIEVEQESSTALLSILSDPPPYFFESLVYSASFCIAVALYLLITYTKSFDTLLKLISPLFGTRHVRILDLVP